MSNIIKAQDFNASNINFSTIKANKMGGKAVYIKYNNNNLRIQMPKMSLPFGVNTFENPDKPGDIRYTIDMSFSDTDPKILESLETFEHKVLEFVEKNSKELFKKHMPVNDLKIIYKSFLKASDPDADKVYPTRLKAKMMKYPNEPFTFDAYDSVKVNGKYPKLTINEETIADTIPSGSHCMSILECGGIWVVGKSFGVTWKVAQLKVFKSTNKLDEYSFIEDPSDCVNEDSNPVNESDNESEPDNEPDYSGDSGDVDELDAGVKNMVTQDPSDTPLVNVETEPVKAVSRRRKAVVA